MTRMVVEYLECIWARNAYSVYAFDEHWDGRIERKSNEWRFVPCPDDADILGCRMDGAECNGLILTGSAIMQARVQMEVKRDQDGDVYISLNDDDLAKWARANILAREPWEAVLHETETSRGKE